MSKSAGLGRSRRESKGQKKDKQSFQSIPWRRFAPPAKEVVCASGGRARVLVCHQIVNGWLGGLARRALIDGAARSAPISSQLHNIAARPSVCARPPEVALGNLETGQAAASVRQQVVGWLGPAMRTATCLFFLFASRRRRLRNPFTRPRSTSGN